MSYAKFDDDEPFDSAPPAVAPHDLSDSDSEANTHGEPSGFDESTESSSNKPTRLVTIQVNKEKGRLGMEVRTTKSKGTVILKVKKDKLAARCGLLAGDHIVQINGTEVRGWNHVKVNDYLRKVEVITITVSREQEPPSYTV